MGLITPARHVSKGINTGLLVSIHHMVPLLQLMPLFWLDCYAASLSLYMHE